MYAQRPLSYAPTPYSYTPNPALSATINLDEVLPSDRLRAELLANCDRARK
jgi:hypothetical protein